jgi:hypothetical protein
MSNNCAVSTNTETDDQSSSFRADEQLRFVLLVLGITEQDIRPTAVAEFEQGINASIYQTIGADQPAVQPLNTDAAINVQHPDAYWQQKQKHRQHADSLQQSVIAAVYADQLKQKWRESTLIVSGLQESNSQTDVVFADPCRDEFSEKIDIVTSRRLGRAQSTKTRSLLIVTRTSDHAQHLIVVAKHLRSSSNPVVRDNLYFN